MSIISGFVNIVRMEKTTPGICRIYLRFISRILGGFRGLIFGWPKGHIGASSRIIGTKFIKVGSNCSVGDYSWIEVIVDPQNKLPTLELGERFSASERLHIACANKVAIGRWCLLGSGVHITDHNHGCYKGCFQSAPDQQPILRTISSLGPVIIGDNVWIGDNCMIIGPVEIGRGSVVAANSVVTNDVPENVIVAGSPAKIVKKYDDQLARWVRVRK